MNEHNSSQDGKLNPLLVGAVTVAIVGCAGAWYWLSDSTSEPSRPEPIAPVVIPEPTLPIEPLPVEPVVEPEPQPAPAAKPQPEPAVVEPTPAPEPQPQPIKLPSLDDSDDFSLSLLADIADGMQIDSALRQDNLLRRTAVFVDNLTAGELMRSQGPLLPQTESFTVLELNNAIYLDPEGYRRFDKMADFLYRLDEAQLSTAYLTIEPLLDSAYQELGYPQGQFRNTLFNAIDTLLAAPEYDQPLALKSYSVNYTFADDDIEALSDAHKTLIRMGPSNTRKIKSLLTRFKSALNE
ncbi:DUF3014 domain-containing protein [Ferrimonas senticii]|uniref:DUF3014 domain-containing protein n=1 Tax=Ferrimonas senticii TaxID=394566 RepID=UPI0004049774|nr:DUF3014 domain-containing protein [Ferrimonas senticii]